MRVLFAIGFVAALIAACSSGEGGEGTTSSSVSAVGEPGVASQAPSEPAHPPVDGAALVERFECVRCHDGTGQADVDVRKHCVKCHFAIGEGTFEAPKDALAEWKPRVMHLRFSPSLSGIGRLVKPEWAATFLGRPHDLRPHLHPMMPRLALDAIDAAAITEHLAKKNREPQIVQVDAPLGSVERGRTLFEQKTCSTCHVFTGAGTNLPKQLAESKTPHDRALAPDLRFSRDRLLTENVVEYILDPASVKPNAAMPKVALSVQEAADLAAFVLGAPLDAAPMSTPPARLPILERSVGYDEVEKKVLHKICWHCHSQPDYARGDGGPGNTGGFGFAPRKLDLSSYESIASGYLDKSGERRSLFAKGPNGRPILVEALYARQREMLGQIGDVRGMPLGLPPLSPEDIQLVETWVAQGHPR